MKYYEQQKEDLQQNRKDQRANYEILRATKQKEASAAWEQCQQNKIKSARTIKHNGATQNKYAGGKVLFRQQSVLRAQPVICLFALTA